MNTTIEHNIGFYGYIPPADALGGGVYAMPVDALGVNANPDSPAAANETPEQVKADIADLIKRIEHLSPEASKFEQKLSAEKLQEGAGNSLSAFAQLVNGQNFLLGDGGHDVNPKNLGDLTHIIPDHLVLAPKQDVHLPSKIPARGMT